MFVNNHSNSLLILNLSRIKNNFGLTDRIKEVGISAAELILEEDYVIADLDPVFYLISYPIVRRNTMFIINQATSLRNILQKSTSKPTIDSASKTNL
jgi:hypothetical protein